MGEGTCRAAQPAADIEHPHPRRDAGEACEFQRRLSAAGVELVYRGQILEGGGVRVFPGGAQRFEDLRGEVAATVVFVHRPVIRRHRCSCSC
jgi:hypothetical protein